MKYIYILKEGVIYPDSDWDTFFMLQLFVHNLYYTLSVYVMSVLINKLSVQIISFIKRYECYDCYGHLGC